MKTEKIPIMRLVPEGIKNYGEIIDSPGFKEFMQAEAKKIADKPKMLPLLTQGIGTDMVLTMCGGKGRSYLSEYLETLPIITIDEMKAGKADGRLIIIPDIGM